MFKLIIGETQIKTTTDISIIHQNDQNEKQKQNRYVKRGERYVATGTHILLGGGGGVNWYNHFGKLLGTIY